MRNRLTLLALAAAATFGVTATAYAITDGASTSALKPTVTTVTTKLTLTNDDVANGFARCPAGYRIFSGGYAIAGQFAHVIVAAPAPKSNSYIFSAWMPPVNINVPVRRETATITLIAWCAKPGQPIVLPVE